MNGKFMPATLLILLIHGLIACSRHTEEGCNSVPKIDRSKEGMLVIGDSISIGYTPYLANDIKDLQVTHTECNAESSSNGLHYVDKWLSYRKHWKVVSINHGYWDMPGNAEAATPEDYAHNLRIELAKIKDHADNVIFVMTTAVIPAWPQTIGHFDNSVIQRYNSAAETVTTDLDIPVVDLYSISLLIPDRDSSKLHFTSNGYMTLANAIYEELKDAGIITK
jgi:lysophospholipase L1-like esterase